MRFFVNTSFLRQLGGLSVQGDSNGCTAKQGAVGRCRRLATVCAGCGADRGSREDGDRAAAGTVVALHLRQKRTLEPAATRRPTGGLRQKPPPDLIDHVVTERAGTAPARPPVQRLNCY